MAAEELSFRVQFEGPLAEFTRKYPGVSLGLWCDWKHEVVELVGGGQEAAGALRSILTERSRRTEAYALDAANHVFVLDCVDLPHDLVNHAIDEAGCVNLAPTRFEGGWETYHVVSFDDAGARRLVQALRDKGRSVEVLASPRKVTAEAIADAAGLSRSTFEEHLRKAEQKLLTGLVPYLELHRRARGEQGAMPGP